jgi:hypothetical protein
MPFNRFNAEFAAREIGAYRYGFNGQEAQTEITGSSSHMSAEFWIYDTRIGRRWNVDPIVKSHESSYACFANGPIWIIDPSGADSSLYDALDGSLISSGISPQDDKTAIWTVDTHSKEYDSENPWKTANKLTYQVGKKQVDQRVSGTRLRENHPKHNIGWTVGDQVYAEDLLDMTDEFYNMVVAWMPYFEELYSGFAKATDKTYYYYFPEQAITMLHGIAFNHFFTDKPFDIKSVDRNNLDKIPTYHASVIGEYSFMNGRLRTADDYGNISFGAWLRILKYTEEEAVGGASFAQSISDARNGKIPTGDPERDTYMVRLGYLYLKK